jgi:predicted dehydrogenase
MHLGFIGGGNITETHVRAALAVPGLQVAAIYGANSGKVANLRTQFGGAAYSDLDAFLQHRPMQMVVIGSPSGLHATQGIAAAENGLHVLVEKPMDITTGRADALIASARQNSVKLAVIFQDRLKPDILRLKKWIDAGMFGKLILIDARVKWYRAPEYYSGSRWRGTLSLDGGGALINQGIHTVDLLLYLFGDVARVQACTATALHRIEAEDTCVATLEFASGALGTLQATTAAYPGYARTIEITGSEGTVFLEQDRIARVDLRHPPSDHPIDEQADQNASASSPQVSDVRGHQRVIQDFVHAIEARRSPVCDGEQGRLSLALVEEIYRAARTREAVHSRP